MDPGEPTHDTDPAAAAAPPPESRTRLNLVWDVVVFQFKLAVDGLRDVLLSPLSLGALVLGLLFGGSDPYQYFRRLLRLGRRTELWINLFGRARYGTSDAMIEPVRDKVLDGVEASPWFRRGRADADADRTSRRGDP